MPCPTCGARTSGKCQRCEMEQRLEEQRQADNRRRRREADDD